MNTIPTDRLPGPFACLFVGDVGEGKSYQCASGARAAMDARPGLGVVWINAEASTHGTAQRVFRDAARCEVHDVHTGPEAVAALRRYFPAGAPAGHVPRLASGHRVGALVVETLTSILEADKMAAAADLEAAASGQGEDGKKKRAALARTDPRRMDRNMKELSRHAAQDARNLLDVIGGATTDYGLLTCLTAHPSPLYKRVTVPGTLTEVDEWYGTGVALPPFPRQRLRAIVNVAWFVHGVAPKRTGMTPAEINARKVAATAAACEGKQPADPRDRVRYAAITEPGVYDVFGDVTRCVKRQGDGEGWTANFGDLVPAYWHPDYPSPGIPTPEPDLGVILSKCLADHDRLAASSSA